MAEPSTEYLQKLAELFCVKRSEYFGNHCTFESVNKIQDSDADFFIADRGKQIGVQHSRIVEIDDWYRSQSLLDPVIDKLETQGRLMRLRFPIYLHFHSLPQREDEISRFVRKVVLFCRQHETRNRPFDDRFRRSIDDEALQGIFEYVDDLQFLETEPKGFGVAVGYEGWGYGGVEILHRAAVLLEKVQDKDAHYSQASVDRILLAEICPSWLLQPTIEEMKRRSGQYNWNFGEVWLVSLADEGYCEALLIKS